MSKSIYVVFGNTGEWSDRQDWMVKAFHTEGQAKDYVGLLHDTYNQIDQNACGYQRPDKEADKLLKLMLPIDPNFTENYTGTHYTYSSVDLEDDL